MPVGMVVAVVVVAAGLWHAADHLGAAPDVSAQGLFAEAVVRGDSHVPGEHPAHLGAGGYSTRLGASLQYGQVLNAEGFSWSWVEAAAQVRSSTHYLRLVLRRDASSTEAVNSGRGYWAASWSAKALAFIRLDWSPVGSDLRTVGVLTRSDSWFGSAALEAGLFRWQVGMDSGDLFLSAGARGESPSAALGLHWGWFQLRARTELHRHLGVRHEIRVRGGRTCAR